MSDAREAVLARTFVTLADTLVAGYDIVELLQTLVERCTEIVSASAAGIILAGGSGRLEVVASTDEATRLIDLMELRSGEGPCVEAYRTGQTVSLERLDEAETRWPDFVARARAAGYASVHSVPLRLRHETIGALNLFLESTGSLKPDDAVAARALADVATIGILQERAFREADLTRQQLQRALDSRVIIEQAKGFVAHTNDTDMDEAFRLIRAHARDNGRRLDDVARGILDRSISLQ